jgi:phage protein U
LNSVIAKNQLGAAPASPTITTKEIAMMMTLGMFVFSLPTLAYQELQRQTEWKHPGSSRVGTRDAHQYTGKGDDTITLSGWIAPELTGSIYSLDALRLMADTGKSWILIQGTGRIYGSFVITSMTEGKSILAQNGDPARIEFSLTLKRTDESMLIMANSLGDLGSIKNMLSMDGIINSASTAFNDAAATLGNLSNSARSLF